MKIPLIYNIRSVLRRPSTSLATALGVAMVVVTFVGMLALATGFQAALVETGRTDNVILLRKGADNEISSGISREQAAIVRTLPEIMRMDDGRPALSADVYVVVSKPRVNGTETHMPVRGVGTESFFVRDEVRITEGRTYTPGSAEVIVGKGLVGRMLNTNIGDKLRFVQQDFTVVGHFEAGGGAYESEVWGDAEPLMSVFRGPVFQSMTMRLSNAGAFEGIKARIEGDPRLQLAVKRESEFFAEQSSFLGNVLKLHGVLRHHHHGDRRNLRRDQHHGCDGRIARPRDRAAPDARLQAAQRDALLPHRGHVPRRDRRRARLSAGSADQRDSDQHHQLAELRRDHVCLPDHTDHSGPGTRFRGLHGAGGGTAAGETGCEAGRRGGIEAGVGAS